MGDVLFESYGVWLAGKKGRSEETTIKWKDPLATADYRLRTKDCLSPGSSARNGRRLMTTDYGLGTKDCPAGY